MGGGGEERMRKGFQESKGQSKRNIQEKNKNEREWIKETNRKRNKKRKYENLTNIRQKRKKTK